MEIDDPIDAEQWQYPQNIKPFKQEIVSTEQVDKKIDLPNEAESWQYSQCIKSEMGSSKITEKPYACKHCDKSFPTQRNLSRHIRTHTGEKPYASENSGKSFSQQVSLVRHIRTHTGEKAYACVHFGKSFSQQGSLK